MVVVRARDEEDNVQRRTDHNGRVLGVVGAEAERPALDGGDEREEQRGQHKGDPCVQRSPAPGAQLVGGLQRDGRREQLRTRKDDSGKGHGHDEGDKQERAGGRGEGLGRGRVQEGHDGEAGQQEGTTDSVGDGEGELGAKAGLGWEEAVERSAGEEEV